MKRATDSLKVLALAAACWLATPAVAETAPVPALHGVLSLNASAQTEVTKDVLTVVLSTTREASEATVVQAGLKQALDAALAEARKVAKPGQVDVRTGGFSLHPRYSPKGALNGWQGSAELVVQGRDIQAIAQLTGRLPTLAISRVGYGLSPEAGEKVEAELTAQAIARFRAKAAETTKQFGYAGYAVREVSVQGSEQPGMPMPMMAEARMSMASEKALPVEPGKAVVSVTVSGSVQMTGEPGSQATGQPGGQAAR